MYPITEAVKALFESNQTKVLRVTGSTVKKLPTNISVYSGNDLVYQSGDGKLLKLYSGSTEIFDSQGTKTVILYSGDKPIFINDEAGMPIQIEITSDNVRESSFFIDRYSCNGEKLEVGTAIASELKLKLDNAEGQFDGVVFEGAELFVEIGIADWTQANPEITYIPCGYFTPDQQPRSLTTITIEALDRMTKFDAVVDATALTFPATVSGLVGQVCTACGMTLATDLSGLPNASVSIAQLPSVNNVITYRNLIQWCAGIMATNAWVDWNGELRFSWYNNATNYVSTIDNRFTSELYEEDLTITGAEYTNDSGIVLIEGSDDYSIDMSGNALAKDIIATVLPAVNTALNGYAYRPFTASAINAPYLWPMDVVVFTDKNGHNHNGAVTNVGFGLNGSTALESKGLTFKLNKMAAPIGVTRETAQFVNRVTQAAVDGLDDELTQQEIFNRLTDNGAAQGLVLYNGQLYVNASYINAGELAATLIHGGTLTLGGANDVNGVLQVLDANGNAIVTLDNNGAEITDGSIVSYNADRTVRTLITSGKVLLQCYVQHAGSGQMVWSDFADISVNGTSKVMNLYGLNGISLSSAPNTFVTYRERANLSIKYGDGFVLDHERTGSGEGDAKLSASYANGLSFTHTYGYYGQKLTVTGHYSDGFMIKVEDPSTSRTTTLNVTASGVTVNGNLTVTGTIYN